MEKKATKILAIETSCDDTSVAILKVEKDRFHILSNIVSSQVAVHKKYGGVYPTLAKREHQKNLVPVLKKALKESGMLKIPNSQFPISKQIPNSKFQTLKKILEREENLYKQLRAFLAEYQKPDVDFIAVTVGPGLEPALWVGVNFARALSYCWNLPLVPVNHLEGHILINLINLSNGDIFPAMSLVVSGGHTQLVVMEDFGKYKIIGETRDDAAGECFDKTARILGLEYPGGPAIAAEATKFSISNSQFSINLPRPMMYQKNYDFSFSGLKTAVLYDYKSRSKRIRESKKYIKEMAAEIQKAVIDVLTKKTIKATKDYRVKTIILGGGRSCERGIKKGAGRVLRKTKS